MKLQICLSEYMFDLATGDDERILSVFAKRAKHRLVEKILTTRRPLASPNPPPAMNPCSILLAFFSGPSPCRRS